MHYNITIIKQITRMFTVGIIYFIIFSTVLILYNKKIEAAYCLLGIPLILICFHIIQRYVYHTFLYIILHGLFFIPALLLPFPTKYYTYLYVFMLIAECLHAVYIWKHNVDKPYNDIPWEMFFALEVIYLIASANQYTSIVNIIFYCGILLLMLHFIRHYIEGLNTVIIKSQNATSVPTKQMIFTSGFFVGFTVFIFFLFSLTIPALHADRYFYRGMEFLGKVLLLFIKGILYLGTLIRAYFAKDRHMDESANKDAFQNALNDITNDVSDPSLLAKIIIGIFTVFVYALLIYLLYQGFLYIYRIFLRRYAKDSDVITTLHKTADINREKEDKTTFIRKVRKALFPDNREKLRQIYKINISHRKEYVHQKSNTPRDISNQIYDIYNEDITELTALYEKARYSNEEITSKDVQKGGIL